jgi:hypothetical protein
MSHRLFGSISAVATLLVVSLAMMVHVGTQAQGRAGTDPAEKTKTSAAPRTPWGDPDLQGLWTNMIEARTPFERPAELARQGITDPRDPKALQEERARDKDPNRRRAYERQVDEAGGLGTGAGPVHWYESLDPNRSRLWFVVDPPDGKVPPLTPAAQKRAAEQAEARRGVGADEPRPGGWVDDLITRVRCITRGVPEVYIPLAYNNNFEIVQSPGYVAILYEWMHETRVIPLDGRPQLPGHVRQWLGSPRGRWQGDTLVVVTSNFTNKTDFRGAGDNLRLVERFTPAGPDTIDWSATVEDPTTWTRPWTFAIPLTRDRTQQWIFEFACHEGNYGLAHILSGARAKEKAKEAAKRK